MAHGMIWARMAPLRPPGRPLSRRWGLLPAAAALLLGGCVGSNSLIKDCCYEGDAVLTYLDKVQFVAPDGSVTPFADVYPGYQPQNSVLTKSFPFRREQIARVVYDSLAVVLPLYDANKNGVIEEPEITVLYLREGALGMGHKVDHLAVDGKRAGAITTSRSDVGGLMTYLEARKASLSKEVQAEFNDMERVGLDIIQEHTQGPDPSSSSDFTP